MQRWYTVGTEPFPPIIEEVDIDLAAIIDNDDWPPLDIEQRPADAVYCKTEDPYLRGWLSCEHSASSYGQPVLILHDGSALGPAEVGEVWPYVPHPAWEDDDGSPAALERIAKHPTVIAARAAGYDIRPRF